MYTVLSLYFCRSNLVLKLEMKYPEMLKSGCTYICQNDCDMRPSVDPDDSVDWTLSSRLYSNLHEIPSFIASHRQSALQITSTNNVDTNLLQRKQL